MNFRHEPPLSLRISTNPCQKTFCSKEKHTTMWFRYAFLYFQKWIEVSSSVRECFVLKWFWQQQSSSLDLLFQHMVFAFFGTLDLHPQFMWRLSLEEFMCKLNITFSPTQVQSKQNWESRTRTLSLINFTTKLMLLGMFTEQIIKNSGLQQLFP